MPPVYDWWFLTENKAIKMNEDLEQRTEQLRKKILEKRDKIIYRTVIVIATAGMITAMYLIGIDKIRDFILDIAYQFADSYKPKIEQKYRNEKP